jgi:hypothetical protein
MLLRTAAIRLSAPVPTSHVLLSIACNNTVIRWHPRAHANGSCTSSALPNSGDGLQRRHADQQQHKQEKPRGLDGGKFSRDRWRGGLRDLPLRVPDPLRQQPRINSAAHLSRLHYVTSEMLIDVRVRVAVPRRLACLLRRRAVDNCPHAHGGCRLPRGFTQPFLGSHCLPPRSLTKASDAQDPLPPLGPSPKFRRSCNVGCCWRRVENNNGVTHYQRRCRPCVVFYGCSVVRQACRPIQLQCTRLQLRGWQGRGHYAMSVPGCADSSAQLASC